MINFPSDQQWPPIPLDIRSTFQEWDAWYSGDVVKLDTVYSQGSPALSALRHVRPTQFMGGLVGSVSRFIWGRPPQASADNRLHLPIAADICAASSDMLFGEELTLDFGDTESQDPEDPTTTITLPVANDRFVEVLEGNHWQSRFPEYAEACAGLGGGYLRVSWDEDVADHALSSWVHADGAYPVFRWGRLWEVVFWETVRADGGTVWRHLEYHTRGRITHELRQGTSSTLGRPVPLTDVPATANLTVDMDGGVDTGYPGLAVVYVPNIRPAPLWRVHPMGAQLGRSDFGVAGVPGLMGSIDEAWTSWMRDLRLGRARLMVASSLLQDNGPGKGTSFDLDQEVYESFNFMQPPDASFQDMLHAQQFEIRTQQHMETIDALMGVVVRSCGYSGSTFGLTNDVAKTATEIGAVERRTGQTREKKTRYWTEALEEHFRALMAIDLAKFPGRGGALTEVKVMFPQYSQPTQLETAQSVQALRAAQAISIETAVRMAQPDLDDAQVLAEVQRIMDEQAASTPTVNMADPFAGDEAPSTEAPEASTEAPEEE